MTVAELLGSEIPEAHPHRGVGRTVPGDHRPHRRDDGAGLEGRRGGSVDLEVGGGRLDRSQIPDDRGVFEDIARSHVARAVAILGEAGREPPPPARWERWEECRSHHRRWRPRRPPRRRRCGRRKRRPGESPPARRRGGSPTGRRGDLRPGKNRRRRPRRHRRSSTRHRLPPPRTWCRREPSPGSKHRPRPDSRSW